MPSTGIGFYTLHSSWHLLTNRTGHSGALGRHFFIQVLFRVCISGFASAGLHCGGPLGPNWRATSPEPLWSWRKPFSISAAPSAQVKCTYEICLHLVVMVTGPAAVLMDRKLSLRPVVDSSSSSSRSAGGFCLPLRCCCC